MWLGISKSYRRFELSSAPQSSVDVGGRRYGLNCVVLHMYIFCTATGCHGAALALFHKVTVRFFRSHGQGPSLWFVHTIVPLSSLPAHAQTGFRRSIVSAAFHRSTGSNVVCTCFFSRVHCVSFHRFHVLAWCCGPPATWIQAGGSTHQISSLCGSDGSSSANDGASEAGQRHPPPPL